MHKILKPVLLSALVGLTSVTAAKAESMDLSVKGFGSVYYGQAFDSGLLPYGFSNTKVDFTNFNLIGADLTAKLGNGFTFASEVVATGSTGAQSTNYNVFTQWAMLSYQFSDGTSVKVGRQRFPIWTASEFINNHHELPFRVMPDVVYRVAPFNTFDGVSVSHSFDVGVGKLGFSAFGGTPLLDVNLPSTITQAYSNLFGARVGLEGDGWRLRAQASFTTASLTASAIPVAPGFTTTGGTFGGHEQIYSAGYRFDKYNIVSWGEYAYTANPNGTPVAFTAFPGGTGHPFAARTNAGYVLGGYRIGDFLPRYTFAQATQDLGISAPGKTTSHIIGLNYAMNQKVTLKGEYELDFVPNNQGATLGVTRTGTNTVGKAVFAGADFEI